MESTRIRHRSPLSSPRSGSRVHLRLLVRWRGEWGSAMSQRTPLVSAATLVVLIFAATLVYQALAASACTTIIVGSKATQDGSLMTTHNNDCEDCDVRIGVVPATNNRPGTECPIHPCAFGFPRYVGFDRGATYLPSALELEQLPGPALPLTKPLGHIPEVASTFRYLDGTYGMMNERSLAIGESTCGAKIVAYSTANGGDALFDVSALTRLALQRCETAQCAVELMGSLAEKHGYFGSEDPVETGSSLFEVAGEALTIIDTQEAWVFHILADPSGRSAIWAAQRVPDDHIAVIPNKFIIDRMNLTDTDNFRASKDIRLKALEGGFLNATHDEGDEAFEFSRAFALDYRPEGSSPGEQLNSSEGERRRWRIFTLVAPSLGLKADQKERFPFSVKVETQLGVRDVQKLMRDHFEGTPYDSTKGLAAGPYGNPNRFDRNTEQQPEVAKGWFERTISIHRTSYSFVAVTHPKRPLDGLLWFAHHTPHTSLYLPLYASSLALPHSFSQGSLYRFSRQSAWWAFAAVSNSAERMYAPIHRAIAMKQEELETESVKRVDQLSERVRKLTADGRDNQAIELMTEFTTLHSQELVARWWLLLDELTTMFRDGLVVKSSHPPLQQEHVFYPVWWLQAVGYFDRGQLGPPQYPSVPTPNHMKPATAASASSAIVATHEDAPIAVAAMSTNRLAEVTDTLVTDSTGSWDDSVPVPPPSQGSPWLSDDRVRGVLIAMFSVILLLVALVFYQLGKWVGKRNAGYREINDVDEEYPTGGGHPTVQPPHRVHTTTRY